MDLRNNIRVGLSIFRGVCLFGVLGKLERRRLLVVTGKSPWPCFDGFALRAGCLLEHLAERWDVSLIVGSELPADSLPWTRSTRHELQCVPLAAGWPSVPARDTDLSDLHRAIDQIIEKRRPTAALFFNGTEKLVFDREDLPLTVIDRIDSGTLERLRFMRQMRKLRPIKSAYQALREACYERRVVRTATATTVVGEDDARMLQRISGHPVHVVPNGVVPAASPAFELESAQPTVMFSGSLGYYANIDAIVNFARRCWPNIAQRVEGARLVIAGREPHQNILALRTIPGVEVRSNVETMMDVLQEAWVSVAPMTCGTGVKNKILEAWGAGRPVVMSPLAANGLRLDNLASRLIATEPAAFVQLVVELLRDSDLRQRHGITSLERVRLRHSWSDSAQNLSDILSGAVHQPVP